MSVTQRSFCLLCHGAAILNVLLLPFKKVLRQKINFTQIFLLKIYERTTVSEFAIFTQKWAKIA